MYLSMQLFFETPRNSKISRKIAAAADKKYKQTWQSRNVFLSFFSVLSTAYYTDWPESSLVVTIIEWRLLQPRSQGNFI